ncbi:MAG: RDD family protein [Niabella sp.]|nr:RDD family protein [Niabella sp.]
MPAISIPTSFNIDVAFEVPGFGRRLGALLIDMAVELCYLITASWLLGKIEAGMGVWDDAGGHNIWAIGLILMVPFFLYHPIMEITTNGQSIGKKVLGLKVVNSNGGKASISQFLIRWLLRVSDLWMVFLIFLLMTLGGDSVQSALAFLFGFGFLLTDVILVASSKKGQRVGDMLAHTIVIRINRDQDLSNTIFREVNEGYVPTFPEVMRINDRDLNVIKSLLDEARKTHKYDSLRSAADRVKGYLNISTDLEPYVFLDKLLEDYNYLSTN